jgi:hypothetical protein
MRRVFLFLLTGYMLVLAGVNEVSLPAKNQFFIGVVPGVAAGYDHSLDSSFYFGGSVIFQPVKEATFFFTDKFLFEGHGTYNFYTPTKDFPFSLAVFLGIVAGNHAYLQGGMIGAYQYKKWDFKLSVGYSPRAGIEAAYKLNSKSRLFFALFNSTGLMGVKFSLK